MGPTTDRQETEIKIFGTSLEKNDRLDSRAIILINALRKWGVLPCDNTICDMEETKFQSFYHQISDLYIFGNGELIDLIYR